MFFLGKSGVIYHGQHIQLRNCKLFSTISTNMINGIMQSFSTSLNPFKEIASREYITLMSARVTAVKV
jgi:hypothetical protein